jgi:hypothetical protein
VADVLRYLQALLRVAQGKLAAAKKAAGSNATAAQRSAVADAQADYDEVKEMLTLDHKIQAAYVTASKDMAAGRN